jgi:type II secretory pathway pseudopilin PulG
VTHRQRAAAIVAVAMIAAQLAFSGCAQKEAKVDPAAQEAALRQELASIRDAIRRFRADSGRYPHTLEELVPKYLPAIPADPLTGSAKTWQLTTEETVEPNSDFTGNETAAKPRAVIIDVQSGAGAPYSNY